MISYPLPYAIYYNPLECATYLAIYSRSHTNGKLISLQYLFDFEISTACRLLDSPACSLSDLAQFGANYADQYQDILIAYPSMYCLRTNVIDYPTVRNFHRFDAAAPEMPPATFIGF